MLTKKPSARFEERTLSQPVHTSKPSPFTLSPVPNSVQGLVTVAIRASLWQESSQGAPTVCMTLIMFPKGGKGSRFRVPGSVFAVPCSQFRVCGSVFWVLIQRVAPVPPLTLSMGLSGPVFVLGRRSGLADSNWNPPLPPHPIRSTLREDGGSQEGAEEMGGHGPSPPPCLIE